MNEPRRSSMSQGIVIGVVALAVAYPISFGPACWIASRLPGTESLASFAYQPLMRLCWRGELPGSTDLLIRFADIGSVHGWSIFVRGDVGGGGYILLEDFSPFCLHPDPPLEPAAEADVDDDGDH